VVLIGIGAAVWWEPAELWWLGRGPVVGLEGFVRDHPTSTAGAEALAERYVRDGRGEDAVRALTPLVDAAPENPDARILLARALLLTGNARDAYAHLQVVLGSLDPDNPDAHWWLGQIYERTDRAAEAYDQYLAVSRRRPHDSAALVRLGAIAFADDRPTVAEEFFRRALAAAPRDAEPLARLAEVRFRLGHPDESAALARRALAVDSRSARANFWLGRSLLALGRSEDTAAAEAAFRRAIATGVDTSTTRFFLAKLLRQAGRPADAERELEENVREDPLHRDSFYDLALCARGLGHHARADQAMRRFRVLQKIDEESSPLEYQVRTHPESSPMRLTLARFYAGHGRADLARREVDRVLKQDPSNAQARALDRALGPHPQPTL
jgi:predicted Zn-dependent protease